MRRAITRKGAQYGTRSAKKVPRNTKKPNFKLLASLFLFSILVSCGGAFLLQTPSLAVKKITITGVRFSDKKTVSAAAEYAREKNILTIGKGPALSKIAGLSEVAQVKMGRTLPNKVWIEIQERQPFAVLTDGKNFYMSDMDGFVFHKVDGPVKDVPLVELCGPNTLRIGKIGVADDARCALSALKCASGKKLSISKISIDHAGNMCLNMDSNFCIKLGQPDELEYKISQVQSAIASRPSFAKDADYIDASCPRAIVWKPKQSAQAL